MINGSYKLGYTIECCDMMNQPILMKIGLIL